MDKKLKFKTKHLSKMDFNSPMIKRAFKEVQKENYEIMKSAKVDWLKVKNTVFTI